MWLQLGQKSVGNRAVCGGRVYIFSIYTYICIIHDVHPEGVHYLDLPSAHHPGCRLPHQLAC